MKSSPAVPGGLLRSKPTWSNASGRSATSAFFVVVPKSAAVVLPHWSFIGPPCDDRIEIEVICT